MARSGDIERQGNDLTVYAPAAIRQLGGIKPATELTPEDVIALQAAELRMLQEEVEKQKIAAHTITRFCICCMYQILMHTGDDVIAVDRDLYERMRNAEIQIAHFQQGEVGPVYGRFLEKEAPDIGGSQ